MIEKALTGNSRYWTWLGILSVFIAVGTICYVRQFLVGQGLTGMGRDIGWGLYISQFTFLVGVAAGGLMLVLPYYIHNYKAFGRLTILGEFLAIPSLIMCMLFIVVDIGQPLRATNMILHPTPNSMMFWDMCVLMGYLFLNLICGWVILTAERKEVAPPKWIYIFVYTSIPFAVSIHTVTAMLYCGLPGRHFWLTAITAPRFLASAFAAGPAIIVIACLIMKRIANFDAGKEAINKLLTIITYAALINAFFVCLEFFVAYYSKIPGHMHTIDYLFFGINHHGEVYNNLVPFMRASVVLCFGSLIVLAWLKLSGRVMNDSSDWIIGSACAALFIALWIDKGLGFVLGGLAITPFDTIVEYYPTMNELGITLGIWAFGIFLVTVLYKIAIGVEHEVEAE